MSLAERRHEGQHLPRENMPMSDGAAVSRRRSSGASAYSKVHLLRARLPSGSTSPARAGYDARARAPLSAGGMTRQHGAQLTCVYQPVEEARAREHKVAVLPPACARHPLLHLPLPAATPSMSHCQQACHIAAAGSRFSVCLCMSPQPQHALLLMGTGQPVGDRGPDLRISGEASSSWLTSSSTADCLAANASTVCMSRGTQGLAAVCMPRCWPQLWAGTAMRRPPERQRRRWWPAPPGGAHR